MMATGVMIRDAQYDYDDDGDDDVVDDYDHGGVA